MKTDIQIARECNMLNITEIAERAGIAPEFLEPYGFYKAKVTDGIFEALKDKENGKLVLVTAINPTPAGEGKTTTTIGLAQGLNRLGKKAVVALREPSLGPCMGLKGGAAGGGYAQVVPMEDINLHFTGDIHAITTANNLLASMIDNHIHQGNACNIDHRKIVWRRSLDLNDRALRDVVIGLGGKINGYPRQDGFQISVASEVMAILCLAENLMDLKRMVGNIIIGYTFDDKPVTAKDIGADGAMTVLLKDAIKPNLVQTLENTPAFIHGGPFANIAHGCNSIKATKLALKLGDIAVTEAGFGADLGAEKFFDIKCRKGCLKPDAVVLVATIRSLKHNGGVQKADWGKEDLSALERGFANLEKHVENLKKYGVPIIVSLNSFITDTQKEVEFVKNRCREMNVEFALSEVWEKGGEGGIALAEKVIDALENKKSDFRFLYEDSLSIEDKIKKIATEIYGAGEVTFMPAARKDLGRINDMGYSNLPVCIAKTQYSLSDNAKALGRPEGFEVTVKSIKLMAGAEFVVALLGDILVMPGLPAHPAAMDIDIDENGVITGLF